MELNEYLHTHFPGLCLRPSIYHQWETGIHIELGEGMYQFSDSFQLNLAMFDRVYRQVLSTFHSLFSEQDDILLVTNVYHRAGDEKKKIRATKVYDRYLKNRDVRFQLRRETLPFVFDEEEGDRFYTSRFYLKCKKRDIHSLLLLKAICNEDFSLHPKLGGQYGSYYPDVFFINTITNVIFFIYDDRGCEVIAKEKEAIMQLNKN
ncbi:DUF3885 domain-containing protein [Evansella sp. AB-rgal1]|uniref:DUF3885 domain-containing protein n=1 Tax=Evansella sp. AB-rgal1 TaxID=3242696 RepID=UPI00359DCC07